MAASAAAPASAPGQSAVPEAEVSRDSGTCRRVTRAVTAATGTLIRKTARQLPACSSHPPRKGAIAADTPLKPAHVPIARGAVAGCEGRLDDRQAGRCHQRAPDTLHGPRGDQPSDARRGRAQHRGQGEPAQAGQEHPPPSPAVAERAGQQDQRGQGRRVARDGPLQGLEAGVQVPSDRGQRDGDHRGVDPGHRRPQDHRRDHPPALRGAVAKQFTRAGAVRRAQLAWLSAGMRCH